MSHEYWQIASGSDQRDFSWAFLKFGMAFVGDGPKEGVGLRESRMIKVEKGHRLILKKGVSEILAIGEVVTRDGKIGGSDDKEWLRDFDGWDLGAYRYVRWFKIPKNMSETPKGLSRGTILKIKSKELTEFAKEFLANSEGPVDTKPEPGETNEISLKVIEDFLEGLGLGEEMLKNFSNTFSRIQAIADYYYKQCDWNEVREHEARTFLVAPLLIALGWAEQQIKIELSLPERKRADMALFQQPYINDTANPVMIVETKGFTHGLENARDQAMNYASGLRNCHVIVVTNGYCYKVYQKEKGTEFAENSEEDLTAYLNILRPKDKYPLDPERVGGCLEALRLLFPGQQSIRCRT